VAQVFSTLVSRGHTVSRRGCEMRAPIFNLPFIAVAYGHVEEVDRYHGDDRPIRTADVAHREERVDERDIGLDEADPVVRECRSRGAVDSPVSSACVYRWSEMASAIATSSWIAAHLETTRRATVAALSIGAKPQHARFSSSGKSGRTYPVLADSRLRRTYFAWAHTKGTPAVHGTAQCPS